MACFDSARDRLQCFLRCFFVSELGRNKEQIILWEVKVQYLYILEMLVQMSGSLWWRRSTTKSSDSIEKETKSGRASGWSARFLKAAVSCRGQRSDRGKYKWECWTARRNVPVKAKGLYLSQYCVSVMCLIRLAAGPYRTPYSRAIGNYSVWPRIIIS